MNVEFLFMFVGSLICWATIYFIIGRLLDKIFEQSQPKFIMQRERNRRQ